MEMISVFKIFSPEDCDFYYNGEYHGHIIGNSDKAYRFTVARKGEFLARFVNSKYKSELREILVIGAYEEKNVFLDFSEVNAAVIKAEEQSRIAAKKKEEARLSWRRKHIVHVREFHDGLAAVERDGKCGFIDKKGNEVISCKYTNVGNFSEGLAPCYNYGEDAGFIDRNGDLVIPCKYNTFEFYAYKFSEGLMSVCNNSDKWGYIDKDGTEVIPMKYKKAGKFSEGLAKVSNGHTWSFIDKKGIVVISGLYGEPDDFAEGLARVKRNNTKWGYIDKAGNLFGEYYECAEKFSEGFAWIKYPNFEDKARYEMDAFLGRYSDWKPIGPKCYFIDKKGSKVLGPYQGIRNFSEGLAAVMKDYKWGFIDKEGNEVIPFKYDRVRDFHEGLAAVDIKMNSGIPPGGNWGYIDKNGNTVASHIYDEACDFCDGVAKVRKSLLGYINKNGIEIIPCDYRTISEFREGVVVAFNDKSWNHCIIDKNGCKVVDLP